MFSSTTFCILSTSNDFKDEGAVNVKAKVKELEGSSAVMIHWTADEVEEVQGRACIVEAGLENLGFIGKVFLGFNVRRADTKL